MDARQPENAAEYARLPEFMQHAEFGHAEFKQEEFARTFACTTDQQQQQERREQEQQQQEQQQQQVSSKGGSSGTGRQGGGEEQGMGHPHKSQQQVPAQTQQSEGSIGAQVSSVSSVQWAVGTAAVGGSASPSGPILCSAQWMSAGPGSNTLHDKRGKSEIMGPRTNGDVASATGPWDVDPPGDVASVTGPWDVDPPSSSSSSRAPGSRQP